MTTDAINIDLWPLEVNLKIYQGDDSVLTVTFPVGLDISAIAATLTVQRMDESNVLVLGIGTGMVISGQCIVVTITKAQATALPVGVVLPFDLETRNTTLGNKTVVCGTIQVKKQKTV